MGVDVTDGTATKVGALTLTRHPARSKRTRQLSVGRQCIATGAGLQSGVAGVVSTIAIHCRDAQGNRRTLGGDVVTVTLKPEGGPKVDAHVIDNTDGTYTCNLLPGRANPYCTLTIMVNGTHIEGSPFKTQITSGGTDPAQTEVFGRGLYDGMSGRRCEFTIQTRDSYGNRCSVEGDKFGVRIAPIQSLVKELGTYLRKYEVHADVTDNGDGTHAVGFSVDHAGFYKIEVTKDCVPVGDSPYTTCIFNESIAFPPSIGFHPLPASNPDSLPAKRPAHDYVLCHDMVAVLDSEPVPLAKTAWREHLHYYKLTQLPHSEHWSCARLRGPLQPPPANRVCLAVDQCLIALCADDPPGTGASAGGVAALAAELDDEEAGPSTISEVRALDLSDMARLDGWTTLTVAGKPPNAVEGQAICVWEGKQALLCSGGRDGRGKVTNDVFLLQLSESTAGGTAQWRTLSEWPASVFAGEGFAARTKHSMTFLPPSSFWIFGGSDENDEPLNDLHVFDMAAESFSKPAALGEMPTPRVGHSACFVAERYLVVYGGCDVAGHVIETASAYDVVTATWQTVEGVAARANMRLASRGGVIYVMGGVDSAGAPTPPVPLGCEAFPFVQKACMDFVGNREQVVAVKPSGTLSSLRNTFTVEAVFMARTFPAYGPLCCKTDGGLKTGFGMMGLEHPAFKGDAEEGARVHFFVGNWSASGGGQEVNVAVEPDTWYHVCGTYDGKELRIYLNGALKDTFEHAIGEEEEFHSKGDLVVGGLPGKYAWDGMIDEVRLWDVCRTEDEVKEYMNDVVVGTGSAGKTPGLLGQWTFNEGAGDMVIDSSGNRNHASYDKYAGGVEMRRVQSRRPTIAHLLTESEKYVDAGFLRLQKWKREFEQRNERPPTKADIMLADPEIMGLARRLGEFS